MRLKELGKLRKPVFYPHCVTVTENYLVSLGSEDVSVGKKRTVVAVSCNNVKGKVLTALGDAVNYAVAVSQKNKVANLGVF